MGFLLGTAGLQSPNHGLADDMGSYGQVTGQAILGDKIGYGESAGLGGLPGIVITTDYDLGYVVLGSLSYYFPGGLRTELEGGYRWSEIDGVVLSSDGGLGAGLGLSSLDGLTMQGNGDAVVLANAFMAMTWAVILRHMSWVGQVLCGLRPSWRFSAPR